MQTPVLELFHPAVQAWFASAFAAPTGAQADAWPAIKAGQHALVAAPTGSGKTLAAFLAAIDTLVREGIERGLTDETHVVYVSPLKALSNDIQKNLEVPIAGIRAELERLGLPDIDIRTMVRTGDTPQADRASMRRRPPHIVVTTPESLYILLTSKSGRKMLATTRTVIVDEIHALAPNKRGAHLALSLERLQALAGRDLVRIGLSATQKPISEIAKFLVGDGARCTIVDTGHVRRRDLAIELPSAPLEAVMSGDVWQQVYDRLAELVREHRTTLIFVNTRRLAERAARHLSERLGDENVTAHHGSLSRDKRLDAEQRLKRGELRALVATASLELGIDIGDVDLVCQIGSTRSIAAFLQRVGRAGHAVGGVSKGRLFPLSRDELCDCAALLDSTRRGELDNIAVPAKPLDVLAQQIVAEVGSQEWREDDLFTLYQRAYPFRDLTRDEFNEIVLMLAEGFHTQRGRRSAHLHRDAVNGVLRGRRGAALSAVTSGGTIPDTADYTVMLEPQSQVVGTVNEDFAVESLAGDVFQLGNTSYRIIRVERGTVRVEDAKGQPPTIPFWLGEAPARTDEFSQSLSRLRDTIAERLDTGGRDAAIAWLTDEVGIALAAAEQIVDYLAAAKAALGSLPTIRTVALERFFDESGGMQLIVHAPFGSRINRAWGLALRKRFCRKFDFELQAAATEDAIVLSLSSSHSFPLEDVARYLSAKTVRPLLIQALLDAPMFGTRWRWNAVVALALLRFRGGHKVAPQLQRMASEDLLAAIFPDQVACGENIVGDREIPDHPLVRQTIDDCLHEAMDIDGLERVLRAMERGDIKVIARDLTEPSPLALEILSARPYAYLDDAPLEERRTQAVMARRWMDAETAADLGKLDADAIRRVREEVWPEPRSADEMHDALMSLGFLSDMEIDARAEWQPLIQSLAAAKRATRLQIDGTSAIHIAAERLAEFDAMFPDAQRVPSIEAPADYRKAWTRDDALVEVLRDRLQGLGPVTASTFAASLGLAASEVEIGTVRTRSRRLGHARSVHARRKGNRMVRAASAGAHPSLHGEPAAARDRTGRSTRLHAVPVRMATRCTGSEGRRRGCGRQHRLAARRLRGAGRSVGDRDSSGEGQRIRPSVARRAKPLGQSRMDTHRAAAIQRRARTEPGTHDADRTCIASQPWHLVRTGTGRRRRESDVGCAAGRAVHQRARRIIFRRDRRGHDAAAHAGRTSTRRARRARAGQCGQLRRPARAARAIGSTAHLRWATAHAPHRAVRYRGRGPLGARAAQACPCSRQAGQTVTCGV